MKFLVRFALDFVDKRLIINTGLSALLGYMSSFKEIDLMVIRCILDADCSCVDIQSIQNDLSLGLCAIKSGSISNVAKAVLLKNIIEMGETAKCSAGICLSPRHLGSSSGLLKTLTGYDSRAFRRPDTKCIPKEIPGLINRGLGFPINKVDTQKTE